MDEKIPKKGSYTVLELDDHKDKTSGDQEETTNINVHDNIEEPFNAEFWEKVHEKFDQNITWNRAMDEVRTERWEKRYKKRTLEVMIKYWPDTDKYKDRPELIASLEHQINRFTVILLEKDPKTYSKIRVDRDIDPSRPTMLHLAAERNFVHVARTLVKERRGLLYSFTEEQDESRACLPVEVALMKFNDEVASYLISQMDNEWIQDLFLCQSGQDAAQFSLKDYILHANMKKTVVAVLDCFINPDWPYLPEKKDNYDPETTEKEDIERAWSNVPDDPLNYHFLYNVLDADEQGHSPKLNGAKNPHFNRSSKSALHYIAESDNKGAIQHPVVRMLVSRKWSEYAHFLFSVQALCYVFFLLVMSFALLYGATRLNPNSYTNHGDRLRAVCEVISILFVIFYVLMEVDQIDKEGSMYYKDYHNLFFNVLDWLGLILILFVIPLRVFNVKEQWVFASLGFLFNFMRLFKFSCVTRTTGLYTKTLAKIIYQDLTRFLVVFAVVFIAFCGALFLSLKATDSLELFSGFELILLAGVRALVEQQPFSDSYAKYRWLTTVLVLVYMAMVVVILLNILIAQLSTTYEDARKIARLQYDVDRMRIITRLESSRLESFNLRMKKYEDGDWISEEKLAKELLEYEDGSHPWESAEDTLAKTRDKMRKIMRGLRFVDNKQ